MSDQRIQYTEEMVGANHPTKSDTLNRLALVETDIDGHGKARFLKEQTTIPGPASGEGVLYAKADGADTCLYYRANGSSVLVARPSAPAFKALGFISGLQASKQDDARLLVRAGAVEIGGGIYYLPEDTTISPGCVNGVNLVWRALTVTPPASGDTLSADNFHNFYTTLDGLVRLSWRNGGWYITDNTAHRVIGLYPSANGALTNYATVGGMYRLGLGLTVLDTTSPPTSNTNVNICLPILSGRTYGDFTVGVAAPGGNVGFWCNYETLLSSHHNGSTASKAIGQCLMWSSDGTALMSVLASEGTANWLRIILKNIHIPSGMAR
ncbi:hypothetical protein Deba_2736 [Desulfarculus baarsii DSM 2075]|uniref:Uncharacterized protein n=1 Tax=Desulfarculus baarsii (strain ATCC 33931 / DSM 2075 / LMG 7858 / VKM B-1802 / 2st14) TaxID=644282 RepID=E1QKJ7_DESB2|nr:hypothetical protein [Desulfarculus baarsii]ADK86090.1 hypothetical protein Deba_2736 [Desulfarculus baarsii DSM 2075]